MEELHVQPTVSGRGLMAQGPLGVFKQRDSKVRVGLRTDLVEWTGADTLEAGQEEAVNTEAIRACLGLETGNRMVVTERGGWRT